jgi:C4-dicarboxylate transporter DctM subunit
MQKPDAISNGGSSAASPNAWTRFGAGIDKVGTGVASFASFLMLIAAFITVYEIVMRFGFNKATVWTFDISGYIFIWFGFLTAAYGLKEGSHIYVDILVDKMSGYTKTPLQLIAYAFCLLYSCIMFIFVLKMNIEAYTHKEVSSTILQFPMFIVYAGMTVGSFLLIVQSLRMLIAKWNVLRGGNLERGEGVLNNRPLVLILYAIFLAFGLYIKSPGIGIIVTIMTVMLAGVPVFTSLGIAGTLGLYLLMGANYGLQQTAMVAFKALDSNVLLAIPLYVLAGQILMSGGIGRELFDVCIKWIGHLPGGVAVATIGACAIFAAISGSSVATAATIGIIALPEMIKRGYEPRLAYGILAAGGTLGIMIPPSAPMIIYAGITEESTGALFMGGVVPGLLLTVIFALFGVLSCMRSGSYEKIAPATWKERLLNLKESFWALMTPVLILAVIYTGICTPTEAAAVAVVYALAIGLGRGSIKLRKLNTIMAEGTRSSTMILNIIVGAMLLGTITTVLQVPQQLVSFVGSLHVSKWVVMLLLTMIFIVLGMFLEVVSILLITMPIVYPLVISLGFNGVWFGIFVVVLMEMALITPPVGLNIYVIQGIGKASLTDVSRGVVPFMILMLLALLLLWFFPDLATWLPSTMGLGGLKH